jgi:hypothetical protein
MNIQCKISIRTTLNSRIHKSEKIVKFLVNSAHCSTIIFHILSFFCSLKYKVARIVVVFIVGYLQNLA